ncbi:MAG: tetratricopeptide repeat protein [Gemmatimonadales bacterium]|nr:tetratricopeptide repeat protein [Gemmatimonadales bacterium]NIN10263.1 tetratricopeptide repeat protein [Gemmatimonadales bacterium]NIN49059.1 tetratricopeptide repeat protein [Gemmatimonadales bacterium]NIP06523.1 tetratricopeptide repeat protein [Gemmatimonadales bacterium]NIQ98866.1 tetratricopeptide repeat protein [Gemmatimonadales bacterium]
MQDRRIAKFNLREDAKPWHEAAFWLEAQPFLEIAIDYGSAGLWDEAIGVVSLLTDSVTTKDPNTYPMLYYYLGYFYEGLGDQEEASAQYRRAATMPSEYGFPFRLESMVVLRAASRSNPEDALAHYYLGNLLYDHQPEAAIMEWERARQLNAAPATLYRNLALAYTQVERDLSKAIASMEQAVARDAGDPRLFYELDLMYEAEGISAERRLALLQQNHETIVGHNDAYSREILLLTQLGRYDEAIAVVDTHHFRRWEGVGNIHTTYVDAHLLRGLEHMKAGRYEASLRDYEAALRYPENLEVAEPYHGGRACQVYYLMGTAYQAAGDADKAREFYEKAATAKRSPGRSLLDYYQGMAFRKLGQHTRARELFDALIVYARQRLASLEAGSSLEFFAKFGTRRSLSEQKADAYYLLGLGYLGSARSEDAGRLFARALSSNPNHLWARAQLAESG